MPPTDREQAVYAVRIRTFLENAKLELPDQVARIEEARDLLWQTDFAAAKVIVVGLFEFVDDVPDNLSRALMLICVALGEDDINPLLKYLRRRQTPEEAEQENKSADGGNA